MRVAYLWKTSYHITTNEKKGSLIEIPDQWEYRRNITLFSVFTTWKLSFDQTGGDDVEIRNKDPFLTLTAFFDNKIIWERYHYNIGLPGWIWWMGQSYLPNFRDSHCYRHRLSRSTIYDSPYIPLSGTGLVKLRKNHDVHTAAICCGSLAEYVEDRYWKRIIASGIKTRNFSAYWCFAFNMINSNLEGLFNLSLDLSSTLSNILLAHIYVSQGPLRPRNCWSARWPVVRSSSLVQNLALVYGNQGRYAEAESARWPLARSIWARCKTLKRKKIDSKVVRWRN